MVAKKAKSKRGTARQKFKIIKNVAEKHRKMRKEAKGKTHKKAKKDIGIPNNYPFKEEILAQAQAQKQQVVEEKAAKKLEKMRKLKVVAEDIIESEDDEQDDSPNYSTKPITKNGYLLFKDVILESDILLITLDCRDPLNSLPVLAQDLIKESKKKLILILTKIDLVPVNAVKQWISYFSKDFTVLVFTIANTNSCIEKIKSVIDTYSKESKKELTSGVIGFPQTGKSSLLDQLQISRIKVTPAPGIIFAKTSVASQANSVIIRNFARASAIPDPEKSIDEFLLRFSNDDFIELYKLPPILNKEDALMQYARIHGFVRKVPFFNQGGVLDPIGSARKIIQEWYSHKMNVYTLPLENIDGNVAIVTNDLEGFIEEIFSEINPKDCVLIKSGQTVPVDMDIIKLPKGYKAYSVAADAQADEFISDGGDIKIGDEASSEDIGESEDMSEDDEDGDDDEEDDDEELVEDDDDEELVFQPIVNAKISNKNNRRVPMQDDFDFSETF